MSEHHLTTSFSFCISLSPCHSALKNIISLIIVIESTVKNLMDCKSVHSPHNRILVSILHTVGLYIGQCWPCMDKKFMKILTSIQLLYIHCTSPEFCPHQTPLRGPWWRQETLASEGDWQGKTRLHQITNLERWRSGAWTPGLHH